MYYGVDGCRAGWIAIGLDKAGRCEVLLLTEFSELGGRLGSASLALVDIPIGLPSRQQPDRGCDRAARRWLGSAASSVFPAPARQSLYADSYLGACDINEQLLGKRLSKQSWHISSKIRQVDEFLAQYPLAPVREMHPEVAFSALNGGRELSFKKKTEQGQALRLEILTRCLPDAPQIVATTRARYPKRASLADDDILDALVGAVTASHQADLATLPPQPLRDERGLPMEVVYSRRCLEP